MNRYTLLRELDPRNDLYFRPNLEESFFRTMSRLAVRSTKHTVRGGAVGLVAGSVIGTLSGLLSDDNVSRSALEGAFTGCILGSQLDVAQYFLRSYVPNLFRSYQTKNSE